MRKGMLGKVNAHGSLENAKTENRQNGKDVLEDFGLEVFVRYPLGTVGEEIKFQRQSLRSGLQLAHHDGEATIDTRMTAEIGLKIMAENVQVDNKAVLALHTIEPSLGGKFLQLLVRAEGDGTHVNEDGTLYAPTSALAHSAPVLERIANQGIRGNGSNGFVPVSHLYSTQRHFNHITICTIFGH